GRQQEAHASTLSGRLRPHVPVLPVRRVEWGTRLTSDGATRRTAVAKLLGTMKWKHLVGLAFGILLMALGLFWFLQGADLIRVDPILCVADCEPLVGGSVQWQLQGVLA